MTGPQMVEHRQAAAEEYLQQLAVRMHQEFLQIALAELPEMAANASDLQAHRRMARVMAEGLTVAASFGAPQRELFLMVFAATRQMSKEDLDSVGALCQRESGWAQAVIANIVSTNPLIRWQCAWMAYCLEEGLDNRIKEELRTRDLTLSDFMLEQDGQSRSNTEEAS